MAAGNEQMVGRSTAWRWAVGMALVLAFLTPVTATAQKRRAQARPGAKPQATAPSGEFDRLAAEANKAREDGRVADAIGLYQRALKTRPSWGEGWWYLATLHYERDEYEPAYEAFTITTRIQPKSGMAWVMLGLCEYKIGRYDDAGAHLVEGQKLGFEKNDSLIRVILYHQGVLGLYRGEFEAAQRRLDDLAFAGTRSENLILALGLAVLRIAKLPEQVEASDPDYKLIRQAGWAEYLLAQNNMQDAQLEFDRLIADFPKAANVYYAYGRFKLMGRDEEAALGAFQREIENTPTNALARIQIAYVYMNRNLPADGIRYAEEAVRLYPRYAQAHYLYGRLLYDTGDNDGAVRELESAQQLAPQEPKVYYALARAYNKANRKDDARRARETFVKLNAVIDEANRAPGVLQDDSKPEEDGGTP